MQIRNRRCVLCREKISAEDAIVTQLKAFCCTDHALQWLKTKKGQDTLKKARNAKTREARERLMTKGDHMKLAQAAVNAWVRFRDTKLHDQGCISCGAKPEQVRGGSMDAGHYRSRGSAGHLRFNTFNISAQCVRCNRFQSGSAVDYRLGLIKRIGLERVERLENDNKPRTFDIEYLKRITKIFRKRLQIYKKLVDK